jgi:NAD+ diphosphatase
MVSVDGTLVFSGNPLSRLDSELANPEWLAAQRADPRARYLVLHNLEAPVSSEADPRLVWLSRDQLPACEGDPIVLGTADGVPHFAVVTADAAELDARADATGPAGLTYLDARTLASTLAVEEAAIVGHARALVEWHQRYAFCPRCGGANVAIEGGSRLECSRCGTRHYPRVDPSIIVLVERDGHALLAGRVGGPGGRKSCVAGFVEPGESIEEAVVREVFEETGVHVGEVQYSYSQPWPFPGVLMIGCRAVAHSSEIRVDGVEIGHADWYTREQVRAALAGTSDELGVPPPLAIAHHLLQDFVANEAGTDR